MPIEMSTINVNGVNYQFDPAALEKDLRKKGLSEIQATQAMSEIMQGDFTLLRNLGLENHLNKISEGDLPPPPTDDFTADYDRLVASLDGVKILDILYALNQAAQEVRKAAREMRHSERDSAQSEAFLSAEKIRSSALVNLVFGVASGAMSIGMGIYSVGSTAKQLTSVKNTASDLKVARDDIKQIQADTKLASSQTSLSDAKVVAAAKQQEAGKIEAQVKATDEVKAAETKAGNLQKEYDAIGKDQGFLSPDAQAKKLELKAAQDDLAAKQKTLADLGGPKTSEDLALIKSQSEAANKKVTELEAEVKTNASAAEKVNADRTASLEKNIAQKKNDIEALTKEQTKARDEVRAASDEVQRLTQAGAPKEQIAKAQARLDSASENFADVSGQLKSAQNSLPDLEARLADSKAQAANYKDPTSEASLKGAEGRTQKLADRLIEARTRENAAEKEFTRVMSVTNTIAARVQGLNTGAEGAGKALQGVGGFIAATEQTKGAEHTAESQKAASLESEIADFQKAAEELMVSVRNIIKESLQAINQTNASIYRNM